MQQRTRKLLTALCVVAVAATGTARAEEARSKALERKLRTAYDTLQSNPGLKEEGRKATANLEDRAAVDAFLKKMPLSPLEYWQIDMEVRHYEVFVPRFIQDLHVRWIELREPLARQMYGDEYVNQVLTRWPVDTGNDITDELTRVVTVGTNRNAAATDVPAPNEYDGEIQIAVNHLNT